MHDDPTPFCGERLNLGNCDCLHAKRHPLWLLFTVAACWAPIENVVWDVKRCLFRARGCAFVDALNAFFLPVPSAWLRSC